MTSTRDGDCLEVFGRKQIEDRTGVGKMTINRLSIRDRRDGVCVYNFSAERNGRIQRDILPRRDGPIDIYFHDGWMGTVKKKYNVAGR